MIIWIIFLIIIIIDLLLCAIYSRMRRKRDFRKQTIKKRNVDNQYNSTAESNIILKLFKWIDNTIPNNHWDKLHSVIKAIIQINFSLHISSKGTY